MILLFYVCLLLNVSRFISVLFFRIKAATAETTTGNSTGASRKQLDYFLYISVKAFCSVEKQLYSAEIVGYTF